MLQLVLILLMRILEAQTALVNVTVDDTDPIAWTWIGAWSAYTKGNTSCTDGCWAHPDPTRVHNSSWHDGRFRSGSFTAQGIIFFWVAVYIYGIDLSASGGAPANISFSLKNSPVSGFHFKLTPDGSYIYDSLFFSADGLDASSPFTVDWAQDASDFGGGVALFDYAVVTVEQKDTLPVGGSPATVSTTSDLSITHITTDGKSSVSLSSTSAALTLGTSAVNSDSQGFRPSSTSTSTSTLLSSSSSLAAQIRPPSTRLIAGGVIGGLALLVILMAVFLCYWKHRNRSGPTSRELVPFQLRPQSESLVLTKSSMSLSNGIPAGTSQGQEAQIGQVGRRSLSASSTPVGNSLMRNDSASAMPYFPAVSESTSDTGLERRLRILEEMQRVHGQAPPAYTVLY
ncbi:hypothetical protein MIND_00149000 [Mycena indigotica]|uniref:Uncharacterized protein n=1 Tax=Mycena indigotica TaxID=2126181 RepID=A0A8H6TCY4_9AGAR|nr:uncharacterized protein MIND_00149000 [Mycena indigotica]KAF7316303.1 hypothetical protein MIND_00149000 [Mycena indigotica]